MLGSAGLWRRFGQGLLWYKSAAFSSVYLVEPVLSYGAASYGVLTFTYRSSSGVPIQVSLWSSMSSALAVFGDQSLICCLQCLNCLEWTKWTSQNKCQGCQVFAIVNFSGGLMGFLSAYYIRVHTTAHMHVL